MNKLLQLLDSAMRYALNLPPREPADRRRDEECGQERKSNEPREYLDYSQWRNEREFGNPVG